MPRPIDEEYADVPAYKRSYFREYDQAQNWRYFNLGLDRMRGLGPNERFAYREINAAEGGGVPDTRTTDPRGPTVAGIPASTLSELDVPGVAPGTLPQQLKPWQWPHAYRSFVDREFRFAGGHEALDQIKHPGVAAFVADTAFRVGASGFGMIQGALNEVRREQGLPTIRKDNIFGPETSDVLNQVTSSSGERRAFGTKLKELRDKRFPEEKWRTDHFLELLLRDLY